MMGTESLRYLSCDSIGFKISMIIIKNDRDIELLLSLGGGEIKGKVRVVHVNHGQVVLLVRMGRRLRPRA